MATSTPRRAMNARGRQIKAESLRLSDDPANTTTDYFDLIQGNGAPSGAYGRAAGTTLLYARRDASSLAAAFYGSVDGGTTWVALQFLDAELTALAGLTSAADKVPYFTGSGTAGVADFTAYGRSVVAVADEAALKALVNLEIGTDVQAYSAVLAALATAGLDYLVKSTITVGDATGGSTDAALTLQLNRLDGTTPIASARQVMIIAGATQYAPFFATEASLTFITATVGSIVASAAGWALVETDATGAFACTARNTDDETLYVAVRDAPSGGSDHTKSCAVVFSNSDAAAWSA